MIKKFMLLLSLGMLTQLANSQDYSVASIPENLKKEVDAVVRLEETEVIIHAQNSMKIIKKQVITVFNEEALRLAYFVEGYDKHTKIYSVDLEYFDANGKSIKKIKKSDFMDRPAVDGFSLYTDNRLMLYRYTPINYPFTVISTVEVNTSNTAFLPTFYPLSDYNISVESSKYTISFPEELKVKYLEKNVDNYDIKKTLGENQYEFSATNLSKIKHEEMSPTFSDMVPSIRFGLNKFNLAGVNGTAESWEEFGKWMTKELLVPRNNLSEETKTKIKALVAGVEDPKEKAGIIYEYVQDKTRYVSVAIGIGGWMPMYANDVDQLSYGDCKALTFYTKSLLETVGVTANYSIVHADSYHKIDIEKDLVSLQGNHAFLMLPFEKDSIYLECTSQKLPFGINGNFTHDRDIVTLTPEGGKVIHTHKTKAENNLQKTIGKIELNSIGAIKATVNIKSFGNQLDHRLMRYDGLQPHEIDAAYKDYFNSINNLTFENLKNYNNKKEKIFEEDFVFTATDYGVINADGSIIFSPNALNRISHIPQKEINRTSDFLINNSILDADEIEFVIPVEYTMAELPQPISIEKEFGTYKTEFIQKDEHTFVYKRELKMNGNQYDKAKYEDFRKFLREIKKNDELKVLLNKK